MFDAEDWHLFGFEESTAVAWHDSGFEPFEAAISKDDGYTLENHNVHRDRRTAAKVRRRWAMAGFEPTEARRWRQWMFSAAEAEAWRRAGFDLAEASDLRARQPNGSIPRPDLTGTGDEA